MRQKPFLAWPRWLGGKGSVRSYEGASKGRRVQNWTPQNGSANSLIGMSRETLVARSRDLVRNDANATKAVSQLTADMVGTGIVPKAKTGNKGIDKRLDEAWAAWADECESSGQMDFYGCQVLAARAFLESGEVLVRRRIRRMDDGYTVPMQIQMLECDLLDASKTGPIGNGRYAFQGVEVDPIGARTAYWMFPYHPSETLTYGNIPVSVPVPAAGVTHIFEVLRPGQIRGVPWSHSVIVKLRELGDYDGAELVRKRAEASMVAIVLGGEDRGPDDSMAPLILDANGDKVEELEPGLIGSAPFGKDIKFNQPATVGGYAEYRRSQLQTVAAGYRCTYESLSGDLSGVNFSSIRAGQVAYQRILKQAQQTVFIRLFCRVVWRWFVEVMIDSGQIRDIGPKRYGVEWFPPRMEQVDRLREAQADEIELRNGISSLPDIVAGRGGDPDAHIDRLIKFLQKLKTEGVTIPNGPAFSVETDTGGGANLDDPEDGNGEPEDPNKELD